MQMMEAAFFNDELKFIENDSTPLGVYTGYYLNNKFSGPGMLISEEGTYYGNFHEGKRSLGGRMEYKDGNVYEGQWEDDQRKE